MGLGLLLTSCSVGPDYKKPEAPTAAQFKEQAGWKASDPRDEIDRGAWWSVYKDPVLDDLEKQIDISNQTLKQSEAAYRQARAVVDQARASFFPTLTGSGSAQRSFEGPGARSSGTSMIDATIVRAHQHSAGARKKGGPMPSHRPLARRAHDENPRSRRCPRQPIGSQPDGWPSARHRPSRSTHGPGRASSSAWRQGLRRRSPHPKPDGAGDPRGHPANPTGKSDVTATSLFTASAISSSASSA